MKTKVFYILRYIGVACVLGIMVCGFQNRLPWSWIAIGLMVPAIGIDVLLVIRDKQTISSLWRDFIPRWLDFAVLFIVAVTSFVLLGPVGFALVSFGFLLGHLEGDF